MMKNESSDNFNIADNFKRCDQIKDKHDAYRSK